MSLWKYLSYIITLLILTNFSIAFYNFKFLKKRDKYLAYFLCFSFITQLCIVLMALNNTYNLWVLPIYTFGEYVFFHQYLYESTTFEKSSQKKAAIVLFFAMSLFILKEFVYINPTKINNITIGIKAFIFSAWVILIFIKQLKNIHLYLNSKDSFAYAIINFGILLYFSSQFIVFLLGNYILYILKSSQSQLIWTLYASINFIFYTILLFGLWKLISIRKN